MCHVSEEGLNLLKSFEGFSSTIFICPAGHPTIRAMLGGAGA